MGALTKFLEFAVEKGLIEKVDEVGIAKLVQQTASHVAESDILGMAKGESGKLLSVLNGLEKAGVKVEPSVLSALKDPKIARQIEMGYLASPEGQAFTAVIHGEPAPVFGGPRTAQQPVVGQNTLQTAINLAPGFKRGAENFGEKIGAKVAGNVGGKYGKLVAGTLAGTTIGGALLWGAYELGVLPVVHGTQQIELNNNNIRSTNAQAGAATDCTPDPNYLKSVREAKANHQPIPAAPKCGP